VNSPYLTKAEAAGYARVSVRTIERAIKAGDLEAGGTPGRRLVRQEWVDEWLGRARRDRNGH
jgi:excisionase family DNA binding protein